MGEGRVAKTSDITEYGRRNQTSSKTCIYIISSVKMDWK